MKKQEVRQKLSIKQVTTENIEQFNKLLRYAFQVTDSDLLKFGWNNEEITQSKYPILKNAYVLGWFNQEKLVSQIALYPMQINIYNKIFNMGGITAVATYPEYTGIGLMNDLMYEILKIMRNNQQSISCLYPYSIPYYRSRGWEIISDKMTFSLQDRQIPKIIQVNGMMQRVEKEHPDLICLHNTFAHQTHGCLIRNKLEWDEYWRWDVEDEIVALYYNEHNQATGYIVYLLEKDIFKIKEMVYLNEEARHGIWGYINAHQSMFDKVEGANYSNHNLAFLLEDGHIKETTQPYIMARVVDAWQFLSQYPFEVVDFNADLCFALSDPLLEWNNKNFVLMIRKNHIQLKIDKEEYENIVYLDIQTLATMLFGYKRPLYLRQVGRLKADNNTINILEEILPEGKAYFSDYF